MYIKIRPGNCLVPEALHHSVDFHQLVVEYYSLSISLCYTLKVMQQSTPLYSLLPVSELYTEVVIVTLGVMSDFRRQGVASKLLRHVISLAQRDPDISRIRLDVHKKNDAAIRLYEKLGFSSLCLNKSEEWIMIKHTE